MFPSAELRARADADDGYTAGVLAGLLAERGDLDELRARADAGDEPRSPVCSARLVWWQGVTAVVQAPTARGGAAGHRGVSLMTRAPPAQARCRSRWLALPS